MPIKILGKEYYTVAERVREVHEKYPGRVSIVSEIEKIAMLPSGAREVIAKATLTIAGEEGKGSAQTFVNYAHKIEDLKNRRSPLHTSWLEFSLTSAIGRALAAAGYTGGEFASADELQDALEEGKSDASGSGDEGFITKEQRDTFMAHLRNTYDLKGKDKERVTRALSTAGIKSDPSVPVKGLQLATCLMLLKEGEKPPEEEGEEDDEVGI